MAFNRSVGVRVCARVGTIRRFVLRGRGAARSGDSFIPFAHRFTAARGVVLPQPKRFSGSVVSLRRLVLYHDRFTTPHLFHAAALHRILRFGITGLGLQLFYRTAIVRHSLPPFDGSSMTSFFFQDTLENFQSPGDIDSAPEISNEIEMQVRWPWCLSVRWHVPCIPLLLSRTLSCICGNGGPSFFFFFHVVGGRKGMPLVFVLPVVYHAHGGY